MTNLATLLTEAEQENAKEREEKMKLEVGKKYITRGGWLATCVHTGLNRSDVYSVVVVVHHMTACEDIVRCHHPDGAFTYDQSDYDIIAEAQPWDEFKIDDPVIARPDGYSKERRWYFAGVINGIPHVFMDGATSWTARNATLPCESVRRPTEEELKGGAE